MNYCKRNLQVINTTSCRLQVFAIILLLLSCTTLFGEIYSTWGELHSVYRIKKGDTLLIAVIGQPEYTQTVQVRDDGRISYFGGDLQVAGKNTEDVNKTIREYLLKQKMVNNPIVLVSITSLEQSVYVAGAVNNPGRYIISPESDIDLYRAIALAGGMTEKADVQQVQLIRVNAPKLLSESVGPNLPKEKKPPVQYETYNLSIDQQYRNIRVNARDLVYVRPLATIEIQGEVKNPGKFFVKNNISIANALTRAGGFTEEANLTSLVKVNRDGTLNELSVSEQFWKSEENNSKNTLSDGDVLFVPNALKIEPIYVTGYVQTPGAYKVRGPITLQKAIALAGGFLNEANRKKFHIHRTDGTTSVHHYKPGTDTTLLYPGDILETHKRFEINWGLISTISSTTIAITYFIINLTND